MHNLIFTKPQIVALKFVMILELKQQLCGFDCEDFGTEDHFLFY